MNYYRSTSPKTISKDPIIATKSAIITPLEISGKTERLQKLGPLAFTLNGLSDFPSAIK